MLGSPSFHSYRDANSGTGKPNLELGNRIFYEDQAYSVRITAALSVCCIFTNVMDLKAFT